MVKKKTKKQLIELIKDAWNIPYKYHNEFWLIYQEGFRDGESQKRFKSWIGKTPKKECKG